MSNLTVNKESLDLNAEMGPAFTVKTELGPSFQLSMSSTQEFSLTVGTKTSSLFAGGGERGPQGEQGIQGIQGIQGEIGPVGPQGEQGIQGPQGIQGEIGPVGPEGAASVVPGPTGPQGIQGNQGEKGDPSTVPGGQGPEGPQGIKGDQGERGLPGYSDIPGPTGPQGPAGPAGPMGPTGNTGAQGNTGTSILSGSDNPLAGEGNPGDFYFNTLTQLLYGPKQGTVWGSPISLKGATGNNGEGILHGTGTPTTQGNTGDFYLRTSDYTLYGPKASGIWPAGISLIGPAGPEGPQGADSNIAGPIGPQGVQGPQGLPGADGADGLDGVDGADGVSNIPGPEGPEGPQGPAGPAGADSVVPGPAGANGTDGADGSDGADGVGVPVGGTANQVLAKVDGADHNTQWVDQTGGGGGLADAPNDANAYARSGEAWVDIDTLGLGGGGGSVNVVSKPILDRFEFPLSADTGYSTGKTLPFISRSAGYDDSGLTNTAGVFTVPASLDGKWVKMYATTFSEANGADYAHIYFVKNGVNFQRHEVYLDRSYGDMMANTEWFQVNTGDLLSVFHRNEANAFNISGSVQFEIIDLAPEGDTLAAGVSFVGAQKLIPTFNPASTNSWIRVSADAASFDTGNFDGTNQFVIPSGVSQVVVKYFVKGLTGGTADNQWQIRMNGGTLYELVPVGEIGETSYSNGGEYLETGVVDVVEGDYFELYLYTTATAQDYKGWMTLEAVTHSIGSVETYELTNSQAYGQITNVANQSIPSSTTTVVPFDTLSIAEGGFTLSGDGLVVPAGVTRVRVDGTWQVDVSPGISETETFIRVNGSPIAYSRSATDGWGGNSLSTGIIEVSPGDIITLALWSTDALTLRTLRTRLTVEAIKGSMIYTPDLQLMTRTESFNITAGMMTGRGYMSADFSAAGNITVPEDLDAQGALVIEMTGTGTPTFVAGTNVTINSFGSLMDIAGQYGAVTLMPKAPNVYTLFGNLA